MAPSKPLITIIGSLNIDFVTITPRVPSGGETLTATSMTVHAGGKGANQAVACGRASFTSPSTQDIDVEMIGCVGANDPYYASLMKPTLEKSGVSTAKLRELEGENVQTGTATILVEEGSGQNRILVVPGANYQGPMHEGEEVWGMVMGNGGGKPDVVVLQGEIPRKTTLEVLERFGKDEGTKVVFNPAPVFEEGVPKEVLRHVDYLIVNETECLLLARGVQGMDLKVQDEENMTREELDDIAQAYTKIGVKNLLVTLGAKGVFFASANGIQDLVAGLKVKKVVDTTAAGDTFVGYFAAAIARHSSGSGKSEVFDVAAAVARANTAAAACVQRAGAMESIPFGHEIS